MRFLWTLKGNAPWSSESQVESNGGCVRRNFGHDKVINEKRRLHQLDSDGHEGDARMMLTGAENKVAI